MANLLRAELRHMGKTTVFRQLLVCMLLGGVGLCLFNYYVEIHGSTEPYVGEQLLYVLLPMICFVCAFWVSMFLGREYDYGTIRNKLIAGHSRGNVYLACVLTCMTGCVLLSAAMLLGALGVSLAVMDGWRFGAAENGYFVACTLLTAAVYGALYGALTLNCGSRAVAVCLCIGAAIGMMMVCSMMQSALNEAEMTYDFVQVTMDGVEFGPLVENPAYVGGWRRDMYELIVDLLPFGQNINLNNTTFDRCERWAVLSLLMLPLVTVPGYLGFCRKDLR